MTRELSQMILDSVLKDAIAGIALKSQMTDFVRDLAPVTPVTEESVEEDPTTTPKPAPKGPPLGKNPLVGPRDTISYLPHQETGVRWMLDREAVGADICRGGILADDMGLGKTFQTIGLIKNNPLKTLILCPPALIAGWTEELEACGLPVVSLEEAKRRDSGYAVVVLATYNRAHLHARDYRGIFERVVLDEGHIIRNGKATKRWWSCMAIAKKAVCRWILSATPVQNGEKDWINLCWWLHVKAKPSDIVGLAPIIMLRRTMEDIRMDPVLKASVPPEPTFIRHSLSIPEEGPSRTEYKVFRALTDNLSTIMDSHKVSALLKLELYMRIQQFVVHPQIYIEAMRAKFKGAYPRPDWTGTTTKFSAFTEVLSASEEPTIVFCNFRAEMDMVRDHALERGWKVWSIRGGMGSEAIGLAVKEAKALQSQNDDLIKKGLKGSSAPRIIVQIVAGGAGINLQFCTRILFLSQHWNPAVVHQACGRAVRIGQSKSVSIHFFSVDDSVSSNIDRRMLELHLGKVSLSRTICHSFYIGSSW